MKRLLSLSLFLMIAAVSFAHDFQVKNADGKTIYYNITSSSAPYTVEVADGYDQYTGAVTIPKSVSYGGKTYSVTSIGVDAFSGCSGLTSITIPNSVTTIDYGAFSNCSGLTSITIPNSVTSISYYAFYGCSGLKSVTIGNSVTSIGNSAFEVCSSLTSIVIEKGNTKYDSRNNCNAIIETASNTLILGCKTTVIPNSVTSIGDYAFSSCSGLTSITIPNSVTTIGDYAFGNCSALTSITIPNSVTTIGENAFYGTTWYDNQPNGLLYIGKVAYKYKGTMPSNTKIVLKEGTLVISDGAFSGCSGLTSIKIPNSVTSIGWSAFEGCSGLTSVTIPNSVTSIGIGAFSDCSGLTSITIPNSVITIGSSAFSCSGLTSITIPNSVTSIGDYAFGDCTGLTELVSLASIPPICNAGVFMYVDKSLCTLKVPKGSKDDYSQADGWKDFANIEEVDVTAIEAVAAESMSNSEITDI